MSLSTSGIDTILLKTGSFSTLSTLTPVLHHTVSAVIVLLRRSALPIKC